MIKTQLRSGAAVWAAGISWILVAILQRLARGFDPIRQIWDPRWEEEFRTLPAWRGLEANPAMIGIPLSILISTLLFCHWWPFWSTLPPPRKRTSIALALVATLAVAASYPFLGADVILYEYYAKVEVVDGENPYRLGLLHEEGVTPAPEGSFWEGQASPYGPLVQRLAVSLYSPRRTHRGNVLVLRAAWILAYAVIVFLILRSAEARRRSDAHLHWFLLTCPVVFLELVLQAHTEMLLVIVIATSLLAAKHQRVSSSMFLLLVSLSIKPIGVLFIPPIVAYHLRVSGRRALQSLIYGVIAGACVMVVLYRPYWFGWQTVAPLLRESLFHTKSLGTLADLTWNIDPLWVQVPGAFITSACLLWAVRIARTIPDLVRGLTAVLLAYLLLVAPFFQMWYLTWFIPLVVVHPTLLRDKRWTVGAAIFTVSAFWGSYGLQFVSATQDRPLRMMSLLSLGPTLVFVLGLLLRTARRSAYALRAGAE